MFGRKRKMENNLPELKNDGGANAHNVKTVGKDVSEYLDSMEYLSRVVLEKKEALADEEIKSITEIDKVKQAYEDVLNDNRAFHETISDFGDEFINIENMSGDFNDNAIIEQYKAKNYKLGSNKEREECQKEEEELRKLLAQRPHNIRSFKCAIQDFERVYNKLVKEDIQDCSNWLLSFTCLMMTNKAGLLQEITRYGHLFWYLNVEKLYPELFDDNFIVDGFSKWVIQGEWNEDVISKEIQLFLKKEKAATPLEILRTYNLPEVDEEIIDEGFKDLLIEVYAGNLSLDEYILFLYNCCYSRMYDFDLPTIDWEKVREGIRKREQKAIQK